MTDLELYNITLSMFDKEITTAELESETPTKEVRFCLKYHAIAIAKAMREFDWSFLTVKLDIDYTDDVPGFNFTYGYPLPSGLFKIVNTYTKYVYEVKGGRIYTDQEEADVYGIMVAIPESFVPMDFYELIAYALAYQIAPILSSEETISSFILQKYTWALSGLISAECHNNSREPDINV